MLAWITAILGIITAALGIIWVSLNIVKIWPDVSDSVKEFLSRYNDRLSRIKGFTSKRAVRLSIIAVVVLIILYVGLCWSCRRDDSSPPRVAFKTAHGRYVSAMGDDYDWLLMAQASVIDNYERFTLLCQDNDLVALQTWHEKDGKNRVVSAMGEDKDWLLMAETNVIDNYERFTFVDVATETQMPCSEVIELLEDDGEVIIALLTFHDRFVTAMNDDWQWKLRAETGELGASEKFRMILLPDDSSGLCSICP